MLTCPSCIRIVRLGNIRARESGLGIRPPARRSNRNSHRKIPAQAVFSAQSRSTAAGAPRGLAVERSGPGLYKRRYLIDLGACFALWPLHVFLIIHTMPAPHIHQKFFSKKGLKFSLKLPIKTAGKPEKATSKSRIRAFKDEKGEADASRRMRQVDGVCSRMRA